MRVRWLIWPAMVLLAACDNNPGALPLPSQRPDFPLTRAHRAGRMVSMSDDDAPSHFVRDILTGTPEWRWAGPHPAVRVEVENPTGLHFIAQFTVADATFKETGPVTINFLVNGQSIGSERYSAPGAYTFDKPISDGTLSAGKDAALGLDVDKFWTSPVDNAKLAVILTKIGLRQE